MIQGRGHGAGFSCPCPGLGCPQKAVVSMGELFPVSKKNLSLCFRLLHFPLVGKNRKKFAYVKREMKDVAGAYSQPKMGILSAFLNIGCFFSEHDVS